jgi:hypothetical protein
MSSVAFRPRKVQRFAEKAAGGRTSAPLIEDQPHRARPDLRRKLVACLLAHGSTFSRVGASGKPGAFQPGPRPQVLGVSSEPLLRTTLRRVTSPSRAQGKKGPKRAHQPLRLALGRSRREAAEGRRAARRQSPSGPEPGRLLAGRVRIGRMQRRQSIGKRQFASAFAR